MLLGWATEVPERLLALQDAAAEVWRCSSNGTIQGTATLSSISLGSSARSQRSGNEFCDASNVERDIETLD